MWLGPRQRSAQAAAPPDSLRRSPRAARTELAMTGGAGERNRARGSYGMGVRSRRAPPPSTCAPACCACARSVAHARGARTLDVRPIHVMTWRHEAPWPQHAVRPPAPLPLCPSGCSHDSPLVVALSAPTATLPFHKPIHSSHGPVFCHSAAARNPRFRFRIKEQRPICTKQMSNPSHAAYRPPNALQVPCGRLGISGFVGGCPRRCATV